MNNTVSAIIPVSKNMGVDGATVKGDYQCEETTLFGALGRSSSSRVGEIDLEEIWNQVRYIRCLEKVKMCA